VQGPGKVIELAPGEEYEITVVLQPELRPGLNQDDLGLVSQIILITVAAELGQHRPPHALESSRWSGCVIGRRVTALLVAREMNTIGALLKATASPFVPQSLRQLLLTDVDAWVVAAPDVQLPVPEDVVSCVCTWWG